MGPLPVHPGLETKRELGYFPTFKNWQAGQVPCIRSLWGGGTCVKGNFSVMPKEG